jgi:hypothetical protein
VIKHADDLSEWHLFIRRAEALFALACEAYARNTSGLAGSDWARIQLASPSGDTIDLRPHTNRPGEPNQYLMAKGGNFGQFYVRSMQEIDFLASTEGVPIVSEKGKELALAFHDAIGEAIASDLSDAIVQGTLKSSSLPILGAAIHPSNLNDETHEMAMLRDFLWKDDATESSLARRTSAWLLLDLSQKNVPFRDTLAVRLALYHGYTSDQVPYEPGGTHIQRWRAYQANELCHIALEALLNGMAYVLNENDVAMEPNELTSRVISIAMPSSVSEQVWSEWAWHDSTECQDEDDLSQVVTEGLKRYNERSGDPDLLKCAVQLLHILWKKWRIDDDLKNEITQHAARKNCSLAAVLNTFNEHQKSSIKEALSAVLRRHVIAEHLAIAGIKLGASGRFTHRFMLEDGNLSNGRIAEYGYTNPRLINLANFLADAKLINANGTLTETGTQLLNETQPA